MERKSERLTSLRTSGIGTLFVGERAFTSVEYFIATADDVEPVILGVLVLTPDESRDLLSLVSEPALLHLNDGRQLNIRLDPFGYLATTVTVPFVMPPTSMTRVHFPTSPSPEIVPLLRPSAWTIHRPGAGTARGIEQSCTWAIAGVGTGSPNLSLQEGQISDKVSFMDGQLTATIQQKIADGVTAPPPSLTPSAGWLVPT